MEKEIEQTKSVSSSSALYPAELPFSERYKRQIDNLLSNRNEISNAEVDKSEVRIREDGERREKEGTSLAADLDCLLCCDLLWKPVTIACDYGSSPVLLHRAILSAANVSFELWTIRAVVPGAKTLPYRISEEAQLLRSLLIDSTTWIPVFVLNTIICPGELLKLHVYENRYKLMIRRCLQGSREFGVMLFQDPSDIRSLEGHIGTIGKIIDHKVFPDGRFLVELKGEKRFFCDSVMEMDGYCAAKYSILGDIHDEEIPEKAIAQKIKVLRSLVSEVKSKMLYLGYARHFDERSTLEIPTLSYEELRQRAMEFSFWVASTLYLSSQVKLELIEISSTEVRLRRESQVLDSYGRLSWCSVS